MKLFLMLSILSLSQFSFAANKKRLIGVYYYKNLFGHVHQNASRYSTSLTTLACGHPVKVYEIPRENTSNLKVINNMWAMVKVGHYEGFLRYDHLSKTRVNCFQQKFPKFFENFDLEISELYHWGRLYDLYVEGKSKVK